MKSSKFKVLVWGSIAVVLGLAAWYLKRPERATGSMDAFAKCLAGKNVTLYGAEWCPHCQAEKQAFGDSFQYVPYVECPADPQKCLGLGIKGYPTWILGDGRKLEGEQGLGKLSAETRCELKN